jgi:hypothetical protein
MWTFPNQAARDTFLNEHFPERQCCQVPGLFHLAAGDSLGVFCNQVTHYPAKNLYTFKAGEESCPCQS